MGRGEVCTAFWWRNLREGNHLGDPGVDGKTILISIFRKWDLDWIELALDKDRWQELVNAVMNIRVP